MKDAISKLVRLIGSLVLFGSFLFFSCASNPDVYKGIDNAVYQREFLKGIDEIKKGQEKKSPIYPEKNAISLYLDKGLLEHYAGNYYASSMDLQEAEHLIQEAFTKSVTQNIASYIANDNTKEYPGEDYEDIYINVFNALNYYNRGNLEGAMVEIRKISMSSGKLDLLSRKYENTQSGVAEWITEQLVNYGLRVNTDLPRGRAVNFSNSALARYLGFLFYLGEGKTDDARIELEQLHAAFADNPAIYANPVPNSVGEAMNVPPGKARLNIIGFAGLSPIKEEGRFPGIFLFLRYPELRRPVFKLPKFVKRKSSINTIEVVVGETNKFRLELLEDMGAVMEETFNARFSNIFLKTYCRVLLKYVVAEITAYQIDYASDDKKDKAPSLEASMLVMFQKMAIDASENADVRMSRYFPDKAYIGGINLDPGTYTVTVNYYSGGKIVARDEHSNVNVRADVLNLIESVSLR
jgi:hypothetical protein